MPRNEQTTAYGTQTVNPATIGRLAKFASAIPAQITNALAFAEADNGRRVLIGVGSSVNAGQVSPNPILIMGDGASGWGIGAVAIGVNCTAGVNAAKDGCICIGYGTSLDSKNGIRIGSALAFGGAFDDIICIGTQASSTRPGVCIGKGATQAGPDGVGIGTSVNAGEGSSVAIGRGAACTNSGLGTPNKNVAIGDAATCSPTFASSTGGVVAIGAGASNTGQNSVALGAGANVTGANVVGGIAIGAGASCTRSAECVIGDNVNQPVTLLSIRAGAGIMAGIRGGATAGVGVRNAADTLTLLQVDESAVAGDVRLLVYDVTAAALKRVTVGAADSGGVGFKLLRVVN